jgi:predicted O-linked N-acetylglucosamine transferase (SPINDLY family)
MDKYERLAVELANSPERLKHLRARLLENRSKSPLFDAKLFAGHLESAYLRMYECYVDNKTLDHIYV